VMVSKLRIRAIRFTVNFFPRKLIRMFPVNLRTRIKDFILPKNQNSSFIPIGADFPSLPQLTSPSFPAYWRSEISKWLDRTHAPEVCVVVHVYYIDLLEVILKNISKMNFEFDLLITNSSNFHLNSDYIHSIVNNSNLQNVLVLKTKNQGRDILPLIHCVNAGLLDSYDYVFKFHTKKSQWALNRRDVANGLGGNAWFDSFIDGLIGEGDNATRILKELREQTDLGLVTAKDSLFGSGYWSTNLLRCQSLAQRLEMEVKPEQLLFAAGSMYACKGLLVQGLRALCLSEMDFEEETGQIDGTTAHAIERLMGLLAKEAGYKQVTIQNLHLEANPIPTKNRLEPKFIAYYLPQFHSDPINNLHWGKNFTEWQNVTRAVPQFVNHLQPLLPVDIGFYDLSTESAVLQQEQLAKQHGIDAFMYYFYEFGDSNALQIPISNRLKRKDGLPFSILWVNENWSRNWDGLDKHVIKEQIYPGGWEERLMNSLSSYLGHPDYLRDSKHRPIFSIYRPQDIPDLAVSMKKLRDCANDIGLGELKILFTDTSGSFGEKHQRDWASNADGVNAFPPHGNKWETQNRDALFINPSFSGEIFSYSSFDQDSPAKNFSSTYYPGVLTRFDNTPRRLSNANIIYGSNPYSFRSHLRHILLKYSECFDMDSLFFINAWNEWAEGAVLEPSNRFGYSYLLALREIKRHL
jgi:lipopolysaccharide biosynthesis protein